MLRDSHLYKSLQIELGLDEDWPEIVENLSQVVNDPDTDDLKLHRDIGSAFTWVDTIQGCRYWEDIFIRFTK